MLQSAHQGYIYQDILGAYFIAQELAVGNKFTSFHFDHKKTTKGIADKFDDIAIYQKEKTTFIQVKYSNEKSEHLLTKSDFANSSNYDLALFDLFETWKGLHTSYTTWRICLAWGDPAPDDSINDVLIKLSDQECLLTGTVCYKFNADKLWPKNGEVLSSWKALKKWSKKANRREFIVFLENLILEVECPKSSLLQTFDSGLEKLLARTIEKIGIGVYPNDHLSVRETAERLCSFTSSRRSTENSFPISCEEIADRIGINQDYGGVEQKFPIDENILVNTPERLDQVLQALEKHARIALTAEPGAGKSWFIENLQKHLESTTEIVKHYCYVAIEDPLAIKRITVNVLYGSLITQIVASDEELGHQMTRRYASNLDQLNILLRKVKKKTLLIIDGIDHIWRVYQRNRGGLTEDETKILEALAQLDVSNVNVSILVVSQPIDQLEKLDKFYRCTLAPVSNDFVQELLENHALPDKVVEEQLLSLLIHQKSNGNALYCKYLVDHAFNRKGYSSFNWLHDLPPYDYNLTGYYHFLYEQISNETSIPYALCGAEFSLKQEELQEITHLGEIVSRQLKHLQPILRHIPTVGYSIYHESFKRFIIDKLRADRASIVHLVYLPLIQWLKNHSFYSSTKAYSHLLKLYYEIEEYDKIVETISSKFIDQSLSAAQPINSIRQNHQLQKFSLQHFSDFKSMVIVAEQSKIVEELKHINPQVLKKYLLAIQEIHGEEEMYRFLWNEDHLLIDNHDALQFLVYQTYYGEKAVHWSLAPKYSGIPYNDVGLVAIQFLETGQYQKFEDLVQKILRKPEASGAIDIILSELEWYNIHVNKNWLDHTPIFAKHLKMFTASAANLYESVNKIISNENFIYKDSWASEIREVVIFAKTASDQEINEVISILSDYNWFQNWLIYLIKISSFTQKEYGREDLLNAFTYLVRDLKPFKGKPRVCDLYTQLPYIKKSFHSGLLLCKGNEELLISCCEFLERVTAVTTSLQGSYIGPLTDEDYLEIIGLYLPGEYVLDKYNRYYKPLGSRRYYSDVAEVTFQYARVLNRAGKKSEAFKKYGEGIQAITAYGFRKDRTLSEILDCSAPYQETYGTLNPEWFFNLYEMAMTVVTHTDGRSTKHYPMEWFEEFIKVFPDEALKFLACETLESKEANWHQESQFHHILKNSSIFDVNQWFLLCHSLPFASSEEIIMHALRDFDQINNDLYNYYRRWLLSLPYAVKVQGGSTYSKELAIDYEKKLNSHLEAEVPNAKRKKNIKNKSFSPDFPISSINSALAFLEIYSFEKEHKDNLFSLLKSISSWEQRKLLIRQIASKLRFKSEVKKWLETLFKPDTEEHLYWQICLFVYVQDGWFHGLHHFDYLKSAYAKNPARTLELLKEISGYYLTEISYTGLFSGNLVKALIQLEVKEEVVKDLFLTLFGLVKHRLPHPPDSKINKDLYENLDNFNRRELVAVILIARLKTLTTFKTRGIIWSLTFIAKTDPEALFRPLLWAFSRPDLMLPIHRAILLQIIKEYIDVEIVPDQLIMKFLSNYPTGFFLEDQHIRSFVNFNLKLEPSAAQGILLQPSPHDFDFFPYIHFKYRRLVEYHGPLRGAYNAYAFKRDQISEIHKSYYLQSEKLVTPIVSLANAAYEIINSHYYAFLKGLTDDFCQSYNCNLEFCLKEMVLQQGSLDKRPNCLATQEDFPSFNVLDSSTPVENGEWTLLASMEKEIYGETFETKKTNYSSITLTFKELPLPDEDLYSQYLFRADQYLSENLINAQEDQPINKLLINDTLEYSRIVFVSPWIIKKLGLVVSSNLHNGFQAFDNDNNEVIKMTTWREDYFGSANDGNEIPRLEGVAVFIKSKFYQRLLELYEEKGSFVFKKNGAEVE